MDLGYGVVGGGGSSTLAGDTDVAISSPANGNLLQYDSGTSKWKNVATVAGAQAVTTTITSAGNRTVTSTTLTMSGFGTTFAYTPSVSGKMLIFATVFGTAKVSAGGVANQLNANLAFGTGTAPIAGAAVTGTVIGGQANIYLDTTANQEDAATLPIFATVNLTAGTAYWFDFQISSGTAGAQAQIFIPSMTFLELGTPGFGITTVGSHRYWGLMNITPQAASNGNPCIAEIELHATVGGAAVSLAAATATATSTASGLPPSQAIDGNLATIWAGNTVLNQDFMLDLGVGHSTAVAEIKITTRNDTFFVQGTCVFDVCYSDDGVIWVPVSHVHGAAFTSAGQAQTFKVKL